MKKFKWLSLVAVLVFAVVLIGCTNGDDNGNGDNGNGDNGTESTLGGAIAVVSREEGSGSRGAFEELVDVNTEEGVNDMTGDVLIRPGNGDVASQVRDHEASIGYISFSTFINAGDTLSGLEINGVAPTVENVLSGDYTLARPFNLIYTEANLTDVEVAFLAFIASTQGLEVLSEAGVIVYVESGEAFDADAHAGITGTMTLGGSTSTETTATTLAEEFRAIFPNVSFTYDATGSGAGITGAADGTYVIGFASREIRDGELGDGMNYVTYALDGLVMVVHPANPLVGLTIDQIRSIYMGEITDWSELIE